MPLAAVPAPANRRDHQLLVTSSDALKDFEPLPAHVTVYLDASYDYAPCRAELAARELGWSISRRGTPVQVGQRWVVEASNSWLNDFGTLRRCTERSAVVTQAWLALAITVVTIRALLRAAWPRYRWGNRPASAVSDDLLADAPSGCAAAEIHVQASHKGTEDFADVDPGGR